jgi:hypothetical protein
MARYFEFLSQFYGFHLTHPRNLETDEIFSRSDLTLPKGQQLSGKFLEIS